MREYVSPPGKGHPSVWPERPSCQPARLVRNKVGRFQSQSLNEKLAYSSKTTRRACLHTVHDRGAAIVRGAAGAKAVAAYMHMYMCCYGIRDGKIVRLGDTDLQKASREKHAGRRRGHVQRGERVGGGDTRNDLPRKAPPWYFNDDITRTPQGIFMIQLYRSTKLYRRFLVCSSCLPPPGNQKKTFSSPPRQISPFSVASKANSPLPVSRCTNRPCSQFSLSSLR